MLIIMKYAALFRSDLPLTDVSIENSCWQTYTAKDLGIKQTYDTCEEAELDCKRLNMANIHGYYGVVAI